MMPARTNGRDHLVGALLAVAYIALLMPGSLDLAMSRDESFYFLAAERIGGWYEQLLEDSDAALTPEAIDRGWSYNSEHPALAKTLFAWSVLAHHAWDLFPSESTAHRFPGMVMSALLLWLLYIFGAQAFGRLAGGFAAVSFALLPRVFYHSHLNCFDVPITLMVTLTAYCYWRSLERPRWAIWTGVAFGLALATKHNSWLVPGICLIHWGWTLLGERAARVRGEGRRLSYVPWWLLGMLALGPPIFVGTWPWLWSDTLGRFVSYANFHLGHEYYNIAFLGTTYFEPPFPVSVPFISTLFTVPFTIVLLWLLGLGLRARALLPAPMAVRLWPDGQVSPDRRCTEVFLLGLAVAPILAIALPSTPIFGGTKHWITAYPSLCMFGGVAFARLVAALRAQLGDRLPSPRHLVPALVGALLLAPSAAETAHSHPFGLSHYTWAAGGVPGAADHGMCRQFWGFTTGSLAAWFREQMPEGGTVYISDTTHYAWQMMQRDGMIPETIRASGDITRSDFAIVHHEDHFLEVDLQAWVSYGSVQPAHVLAYDGVPIITVYENPNRRP